jgi:hypothetical protein
VIKVVKVVFPLIIDHRKHDETRHLPLVLTQVLELPVKCLIEPGDHPLFDDMPIGLVLGIVVLGELRNQEEEVEQKPAAKPGQVPRLFRLMRGMYSSMRSRTACSIMSHISPLRSSPPSSANSLRPIDDLALLLQHVVVV